MSAYEELVERCYGKSHASRADVCNILDEIRRTLETVTPEMRKVLDCEDLNPEDWLAMLRASPLVQQ